jgi:hypothetical protein
VVDEIELLAFNNFVSPNNDGINDVLIENINLYKGVQLVHIQCAWSTCL